METMKNILVQEFDNDHEGAGGFESEDVLATIDESTCSNIVSRY